MFSNSSVSKKYHKKNCTQGWKNFIFLSVSKLSSNQIRCFSFFNPLKFHIDFSFKENSISLSHYDEVSNALEEYFMTILPTLIEGGFSRVLLDLLEYQFFSNSSLVLSEYHGPYAPPHLCSPIFEAVLNGMAEARRDLERFFSRSSGGTLDDFLLNKFSNGEVFLRENIAKVKLYDLPMNVKLFLTSYLSYGVARNDMLTIFSRMLRVKIKEKKLTRSFVIKFFYVLERKNSFLAELKRFNYQKSLIFLAGKPSLLELCIEFDQRLLFDCLLSYFEGEALREDSEGFHLFDILEIYESKPLFILRALSFLQRQKIIYKSAKEFFHNKPDFRKLFGDAFYNQEKPRIEALLWSLSRKYKISYDSLLRQF